MELDSGSITTIAGVATALFVLLGKYTAENGKKIDNSTEMTKQAFETMKQQIERLTEITNHQEEQIKELQGFKNKYEELKIKHNDLKFKFNELKKEVHHED